MPENEPTISGNTWNTIAWDSPPPEPIRIELNGNTEELVERIREENRRNRDEAVLRLNQRRVNVNGQVLDTIGIELESIALSRDTAGRILGKLPGGLGSNFKVTRDGSSEMNVYNISMNNRNVMINAHTRESEQLLDGKYPQNTVGYELISIPMDIDTTEKALHALLPSLECNGDFISERCATHIHVGAMKNLRFLKNALKLGLWFDEVFYSLANMGQDKFRGYSNNAIYARPLVNGPYFKYDRDYYQVVNWKKALESDDLYEFFCAYGTNINGGELHKYHPGRYFSVNLYSIPRIGTIEFRHFNQSFNPGLVSSIAKLCQLFTEIAIKSGEKELKNLDVGDVFTLESPSHYLEKLYKLIDMGNRLDCDYNLGKEDIPQLERIIYKYKGIGIKDVPVLTHCRDFTVPAECIRDGELQHAKTKPIPAGQVDIHNIKYQSIIK
jgi:hypothetical protein